MDGHTPSEQVVGEAFRTIFPQAKGRIIITTFASNIYRLQQAMEVAAQFGRKVAVVGRSMSNNIHLAQELGLLQVPPDTLIPVKQLDKHPDAEVVLSYQIPTYKVGRRRLFLGVWKHGVSIYGWDQGRDAGFTARHPTLKTGKGTLQLRPDDAAGIPDDEFRDLVRAALDG